MYMNAKMFLLAVAFSLAGMLPLYGWTPAGAASSDVGPRPGTVDPGPRQPPPPATSRARRTDVLATRARNNANVVYATTECVAAHPDGQRCNKKTCKKDATSDCADFAARCVEYGHHYAGTSDGGSCSRVL